MYNIWQRTKLEKNIKLISPYYELVNDAKNAYLFG